MDYVEFMNRASEYSGKFYKHGDCSECGGTGIEAEYCCNGKECCCQGYPTDFKDCSYCGKTMPSEEKLKENTQYDKK